VAPWCVVNPRKSDKGDFIVYTIFGIDRTGKLEITRRYSDFEVLRQTFVDRWPGMYIPPIPHKKNFGHKDTQTVMERCFLLNLFIKQTARCPYLLESEEF